MLVAVILAAGDSTRMGRPKALLPDPDGRPFVVRLARTFSAAGVDRIVIVTGALHAEIASALAAEAPAVETQCARNLDPARGQLSSLWVGLDAAGAEADGVLMIPVDIPLVGESTIREVVDAWHRTQAPIVRP